MSGAAHGTLLLPAPVQTLRLPASFRLDSLICGAHQTLDEAIKKYRLTELWAAFSGGHDSLVMTHVASLHPLFRGVIHIDTGTGLKETRQFVETTCKQFGWRLVVKRPATTYEMLLVKYAFPGPAQHQEMYKYLKERPLRQAIIEIRKGKTSAVIGKVGGMRTQESARRSRNTEKYSKGKEGVWISPIHDWTALDCLNYLVAFNIPRSEVKQKMHMSGDCFCGAYARSDELRELDFWYPYQAERVRKWQRLVALSKELGFTDQPEKHCVWGHGSGIAQNQMELMPMCWNCNTTVDEAAS